MANSRINQLTSASIDGTYVFPFQISNGDIAPVQATIDTLKEYCVVLAISELTPQGTDDTTTAVLSYGINTVASSSSSNFCCRLPTTPTQGKSVTIINNSTYVVRVFPSVTGGSINGVIDGYIDVPPDNQAYNIYCYENPNPGDWSANPTQTNTYSVGEMSIDHTNGVADLYCGVGTATSGAAGVGLDGDHNIVLSPNTSDWDSLDVQTSFVNLKIATNILNTDYTSGSPINVSINRGYKIDATSAVLDLGNQINFTSVPDPILNGGAVNGGVLSSPVNVGDVGTLYAEQVQVNGGLGIGGDYSRYYFTFIMSIPSTWPTKTYKFKFSLEYL